MTASVLEDAGYDFADLTGDDEPEFTEPVSRSRGRGTRGTRRGSVPPPDAEPGGGGSASQDAPRRRRASKGRLENLKTTLSGEMFKAGGMAGFVVPVTGYYICQESRAFASAVVDLASSRAEWIDALENIAKLEPGLVVGRTALGIGGALAVDRRRAEADTFLMRFLGVYQAWKAVEDKKEPGTNGGFASGYSEPGVRFQPV